MQFIITVVITKNRLLIMVDYPLYWFISLYFCFILYLFLYCNNNCGYILLYIPNSLDIIYYRW